LHDDDDLFSVVVEWMVFGRFDDVRSKNEEVQKTRVSGDWPKELLQK
jgi:hypothetical protein